MPDRYPSIAIVGAGFSGIGMAIRLKLAGATDFVVFDKASRVGGTWRENTYPGAACDVPSHLYSYSFEPATTWTRRYAPQPEIRDYLEHCVEKYELGRHLRLGIEIADARWDAERALWEIRSTEGEVHEAKAVVFGVGQLNRPSIPALPGAEDFGGTSFHSACWDHEHDLRGKRVAVIGNGASAIQLIPPVAETAAHLSVFQRSPNWIVPKLGDRLPHWTRPLFERVPLARRAYRTWLYLQREGRFRAFREGGRPSMRRAALARAFLESQVADPVLREQLLPRYPIGCKRILLSNDYYPTLCRDDVDLVTEGIERITAEGIVTTDGREHPVDTIVYATGFKATSFLVPVDVRGRDGTRLHDVWRDGASAYLGMSVPAFPNLFLLYGPNTNLGGNSIVFMLECQFRYIDACLRRLSREGLASLEVRAPALAAYDRQIQARLDQTVWKGGCGSWYKTAAGRITNNWPYFTSVYWLWTRSPRRRAFRVGRMPSRPGGVA